MKSYGLIGQYYASSLIHGSTWGNQIPETKFRNPNYEHYKTAT